MRKLVVALVVLVVIVAAAAAVTRTALWGRLYDPFKGYQGEEQFVIVEPGTGFCARTCGALEGGAIETSSP